MTRNGDSMNLYSGRPWWPMDPRVENIDIEDIAHMCALTNRFKGATRVPYSLAEHQVRVSWLLRDTFGGECVRLRKGGLVHDGHEVIDGIGDIVRPVKYSLPPEVRAWYDAHVARNQEAVHRLCGISLTDEDEARIKWADDTLLATEARDLMAPSTESWANLPDPLPDVILPWSWQDAETLFLRECRALGVE